MAHHKEIRSWNSQCTSKSRVLEHNNQTIDAAQQRAIQLYRSIEVAAPFPKCIYLRQPEPLWGAISLKTCYIYVYVYISQWRLEEYTLHAVMQVLKSVYTHRDRSAEKLQWARHHAPKPRKYTVGQSIKPLLAQFGEPSWWQASAHWGCIWCKTAYIDNQYIYI